MRVCYHVAEPYVFELICLCMCVHIRTYVHICVNNVFIYVSVVTMVTVYPLG